jgi:hypothetical protein
MRKRKPTLEDVVKMAYAMGMTAKFALVCGKRVTFTLRPIKKRKLSWKQGTRLDKKLKAKGLV